MTPSTLSTLAERELSAGSRAGHVALLLASLCMSTITGSLWLTEPHLPVRTAVAFAVMTGAGLCWTAYAVWVLSVRRPLLALHRVVASRLAVTFCAAATSGSLYLGLAQQHPAAWPAAIVFGTMTLIAAVLLAAARRRYHRLQARKAELERRLRDGGQEPPG